jgi:folate/biopterin transporter
MNGYLQRMRAVFGIRFIVLIFFTQCFLKGLVLTVFSQGLFPLIKSLGVDATQFQVLSALAMSPWTVKPLFGVLSDNFAIFGYHKRSWMLLSCVSGIVGAVFMSIAVYTPIVIALFVMMIHYQISVCDLLVEGKYSELTRDNKDVGSDIVTLSNAFQNLGILISLAFIGPLSDAGMFRITNLIACVVCVVSVVPVALGWLPEEKVNYVFNREHFIVNWKVITLVTITGLMAPSMAAITVFASKWIGLLCSLIVIVCVVVGGYMAMPHPIIARVALYQVLTSLSRISFSKALDYFFTAGPECLPGGPNFSNTFYITTTGLIGAAAALLTSFYYQAFLSNWKYRNVLIVTSVLSACGGIFDYVIVKRWNLLIGIPDVIFFIIGDDVIHNIVDMLYWIPSSSMLSKVCPKGMESCTFAYLAGVSNFATMVSTIFGAWLSEWFGIVTIGDVACNWDALPPLILIGHIGLVLLVAIPAAWLIPNVPQRGDLLPDSPNPAAGGGGVGGVWHQRVVPKTAPAERLDSGENEIPLEVPNPAAPLAESPLRGDSGDLGGSDDFS